MRESNNNNLSIMINTKTILLFFIIIMSGFATLSAQDSAIYFPTGMKWKEVIAEPHYLPLDTTRAATWEIGPDTTVNDLKYKQVVRDGKTINIWLREDAGKVWLLTEEYPREILLYNFNWIPDEVLYTEYIRETDNGMEIFKDEFTVDDYKTTTCGNHSYEYILGRDYTTIRGIGRVADLNKNSGLLGYSKMKTILPGLLFFKVLWIVRDNKEVFRSEIAEEWTFEIPATAQKYLTEDMAWVDGFGYEQDGRYKTDDVKMYYYTTAGDTIINEKKYFRIHRARKCKTSYKVDEDDEGKEYVSNKELIIQDDTLCFFMHEDDSGDVWLYTEDKNVFYEVSHNTLYESLYESLADDFTGRELFLFNSKKKYAVGDVLPLGMSVLADPNGFQDGKDYWHIYPLDVEDVSVINLLDGNSYPIYNNYFVESIGPLDGPLSGIGSPNSYNLDFRKLFAFFRDGQTIYENEGYLAALEEIFPNILDSLIVAAPFTEDPITFTTGQMATIVLPTEPDASKGKYYRLAGCKDGEIVFEQEPHPQARVPYIIVPSEDFSIDPAELELAGLTGDTVSVDGVRFIGTYASEILPSLGGDGGSSFYYDIIDQTPDCSPLPGEGQGVRLLVGALRAYLLVDWKTTGWNDPYTQGGTKTPLEKMPIVLRDNATSIAGCPQMVNGKSSNGKCYDLQGRRISEKPTRGIYIVDGKKKM